MRTLLPPQLLLPWPLRLKSLLPPSSRPKLSPPSSPTAASVGATIRRNLEPVVEALQAQAARRGLGLFEAAGDPTPLLSFAAWARNVGVTIGGEEEEEAGEDEEEEGEVLDLKTIEVGEEDDEEDEDDEDEKWEEEEEAEEEDEMEIE